MSEFMKGRGLNFMELFVVIKGHQCEDVRVTLGGKYYSVIRILGKSSK